MVPILGSNISNFETRMNKKLFLGKLEKIKYHQKCITSNSTIRKNGFVTPSGDKIKLSIFQQPHTRISFNVLTPSALDLLYLKVTYEPFSRLLNKSRNRTWRKETEICYISFKPHLPYAREINKKSSSLCPIEFFRKNQWLLRFLSRKAICSQSLLTLQKEKLQK